MGESEERARRDEPLTRSSSAIPLVAHEQDQPINLSLSLVCSSLPL